MTEEHLQVAMAELHNARLSLQDALVALDRARGAGLPIAHSVLRVIDAEFRGTAEEAAVLGALLARITPPHDQGVPVVAITTTGTR